MLLAAAAALPLVASSAARPRVFPIKPCTLRRLVAEAPIIVTAKVTAPAYVLVISEVVKGKLDETQIKIEDDWTLVCPAPAHYEIGTNVLAFLARTKDREYTTYALSYGAKTLDDTKMKTYLARVKEEIAVLAIADVAARRKAQVDWLVRCCEERATRWEGAFDLAPRGDPISKFFDELGTIPSDGGAAGSKTPISTLDEGFSSELTDLQRKRLRDVWYASKRFGLGEMCLDELFLAEHDPKAIEWFVARLREQLKLRQGDEDEDDTSELLERLARRDVRPAVAAFAKKFDESLGELSLNSQLLPYRVKLLSDVLALY